MDFKELLRRALDPGQDPSRPDIEQLFSGPIKKGLCTFEDANQLYFDIIEENFPIAVNRIAWSLVRNSLLLEPHEGELETSQIRIALSEWFKKWLIDPHPECVLVGDDCKCAVKAPASEIIERSADLMKLPQHWYVLLDNGRACVQLCMEGYIEGGLSADAIVKGWVEGQD